MDVDSSDVWVPVKEFDWCIIRQSSIVNKPFFWCDGPRAQFFPMQYCLLYFQALTNQIIQGTPTQQEACLLHLTLLDSLSPASYHVLASLRIRLCRLETMPKVSAF